MRNKTHSILIASWEYNDSLNRHRILQYDYYLMGCNNKRIELRYFHYKVTLAQLYFNQYKSNWRLWEPNFNKRF